MIELKSVSKSFFQAQQEIKVLQDLAVTAENLSKNPALLRLRELETLKELAKTANARIYIGFDKHLAEKED